MTIWSGERKEIENLHDSIKGQFPDLDKEMEQLIKTEDANVIMLYARRCLEVIVTELCECELKRPRKTEPLKGIIDKLNSEEKVPSHIITSMHGLNSLSTYGTHPKYFDPEQVKPALSNLAIILKWYLKYKESQTPDKVKTEGEKAESMQSDISKEAILKPKKKYILLIPSLMVLIISIVVLVKTNVIDIGKQVKDIVNLEKSVAVLPFRNDSPDSTNIYFINGIMEAILNNLQKIKDIRVISRTSVEQFRNNTVKSIPDIAKELGVNFIAEGSGQKIGNTIRLSVQLLRADKEGHLWGNFYDQEIHNASDILIIESQIAQAIVSELKAVITPEEKLLIEKIPTKDLEALDAYLKGMFYFRTLTSNDLETAMKYFELAKERDPEFALAYAGIGLVWAGRQQISISRPEEAGPKAEAAISRALELDSTLSDVHRTLASIKVWTRWDWKGGEASFRKAIELDPNYSLAHSAYSHLLNILGRPDEAMKHIEIALQLDPLNPQIKAFYGIDLMFVHRYNDAVKAFQEALELSPMQGVAFGNIVDALYSAGREDEALELLRIHQKDKPEYLKAIDEGYAEAGWTGAMKKLADLRSEKSQTIYISPYAISVTYALADDVDNAIYWLEKAFEEHNPNLPYLLHPNFDKLRDDPRFQDLCRRMNLPYKLN